MSDMNSTWKHNQNRLRLRNPSGMSTAVEDTNVHCSPWHFFHCLGTNECVQIAKSLVVKYEPGYIILFNHKFDKDSALISNNKLLFRMACQCLMLIDHGYKGGLESTHMTRRTNTTAVTNFESVPDANFLKSRKQISEFLAYVCNHMERITMACNFYASDGSNDLCSKGNVFSSTSENMVFLQSLLSKLCKIHNTTSVPGSMYSYHLLHTCLDIYCYHLDFLLGSIERQKAVGYQDGCHASYGFEKHVNLFLSELLSISVTRFHLLSKSDLANGSPFSCSCVEQVWVMLITLLDVFYDKDSQNKSFWSSINNLLEKVSSESQQNKNLSNDNFAIPEYFLCKEPEIFKLWLISHIGLLYQCHNLPVRENFILVEAIMKQVLAPDNSVPEATLQTIILLVTPLVCNVWSSKSEVVMILWEYFHRRLNSIFLQQNASIESLRIIKKTSEGMLTECKGRIDENFNEGDSWGLFLHLLGRYLKKSQQKHWNQVRGRIYSKFSVTKLQALTELGLYRFSSLFLTLCVSVGVQESSNKLLDLLAIMNPTDLLRCQVVWRTQFALIMLYIEHDMDITTVSQPLRQQLNNVADSKDVISVNLMKIVVEELQTLTEVDSFIKLSGQIFVNSWMSQYLSSCSEPDACQLYGVLLSLTLKLQHIYTANSPVTPHASALAESLWQHILPCLLSSPNCKPSDTCESESLLGFQLTLLPLHLPRCTRSFTSIFCRFVNNPNVNVKVLRKYMCLIIGDTSAKNAIQKMDNYQGLIVRSWLRCLMLSLDGRSKDMCTFTRVVSELPEIMELSLNQKVNLNEECDTLGAFLTMLANSGTKYSDRVNFYLSQVEASLTRTNISSQELALHLYNCAATFVQYAPNIIYSKTASHSKTSNLLNSIISHLLLPASVYSSDIKIRPIEKNAIGNTLHLFIRALVCLNPHSDPYIFKCVKDLIVQYLPRLVQDQPNTIENFLQSETISHPLLKCFDDSQSFECEETGRFVLEVLSSAFIACKGKTKNKYTTIAIAIVKALLQKWNGNMKVLQVVTNAVMGSLLELVMFTEGTASNVHQKGLEILQMILSKASESQGSQGSILVNIAKDHLAFSAVYVFRLLETLVKLDPQLVRASLPRIEELVSVVEQKRGVVFDRGLRSGIKKIELMLDQRR